jgi:hypothetical protein
MILPPYYISYHTNNNMYVYFWVKNVRVTYVLFFFFFGSSESFYASDTPLARLPTKIDFSNGLDFV